MNITQITVNYGLLSELAYLRLENDWFEGKRDDGTQRSNKNIDDIKKFITDNNKETTGIS